MAKLHLTPSGQARACSAQPGQCLYGKNGVDPEHYATKEEAQAAYEKKNAAQVFTTTKKAVVENNTVSDLPKHYRGNTVDEVLKNLKEDYEALDVSENFTRDMNKELFGNEYNYADYVDIHYLLAEEDTNFAVDESKTYDDDDRFAIAEKDFHFEYDVVHNEKAVYFGEFERVIPADYYNKERSEYNELYKLNDELAGKIRDFEKQNKLRDAYNTLQDPTLPDWAAIPNSAPAPYVFFGSNYDYEKTKAQLDVEEKNLANVDKRTKNIKRNKELLEKQEKNKAILADIVDKSTEPIVLDALKAKMQEVDNNIKTLNNRINTASKKLDKDAYIEKIEVLKNEVKELGAKQHEKNRKAYIEALAAHHTSPDRKVRIKEATKWYDEHEDINMKWKHSF